MVRLSFIILSFFISSFAFAGDSKGKFKQMAVSHELLDRLEVYKVDGILEEGLPITTGTIYGQAQTSEHFKEIEISVSKNTKETLMIPRSCNAIKFIGEVVAQAKVLKKGVVINPPKNTNRLFGTCGGFKKSVKFVSENGEIAQVGEIINKACQSDNAVAGLECPTKNRDSGWFFGHDLLWLGKAKDSILGASSSSADAQ